jgi:arabinofuranosyltransferase
VIASIPKRLRVCLVPLSTALIAGVVVALQLRTVGDFRVDDAYISFAFSKNLARGRGLIFSHDVHVEGYTNFLWTVLNALPIRLLPDADPLIAARAACVASLFGLLLATWKLARAFTTPLLAATAVVCISAWTDLARAALSGLETLPHAMLLAFGANAYVRELDGARRHSLWWFVAAALIRISSVGSLAFVCAFELALRASERTWSVRAFIRWAGLPLASFAVYFAWRFYYYELPLPTTYYAKNLVTAADPDRGATYLWDAARDLGALPILALGVVAVARTFEHRRLFLVCMAAFEAICVAKVGGDWMPFNRFCIPLAAPLVVLFATGLGEVWTAVARRRWTERIAALGLSAATWAWCVVHADAHRVETPAERSKLATAAHVQRHTMQDLYAVRAFFSAMIRKPGEVLATDYGGVLGYFTEASIVEMWGLCNRDIALLGNGEGINPIYGKTCLECYRRFDPDYFHVMVPMVRAPDAFASHDAVVDQIFQGRALDRVLRLRTGHATGRVLSPDRTRALFFIEKRREGITLSPRVTGGGFVVDYPFEPGGVAAP